MHAKLSAATCCFMALNTFQDSGVKEQHWYDIRSTAQASTMPFRLEKCCIHLSGGKAFCTLSRSSFSTALSCCFLAPKNPLTESARSTSFCLSRTILPAHNHPHPAKGCSCYLAFSMHAWRLSMIRKHEGSMQRRLHRCKRQS